MKNSNLKKIENAFKNYQELKRIAAEAYADAALSGLTANYAATGTKGGVDNKVEERVLQTEAKAYNAWRWCLVVEKTYDHYRPDGKSNLIDLQYFQRLPKWKVAKRLHIAERTRVYWQEEILTTALYWVVEYNLGG